MQSLPVNRQLFPDFPGLPSRQDASADEVPLDEETVCGLIEEAICIFEQLLERLGSVKFVDRLPPSFPKLSGTKRIRPQLVVGGAGAAADCELDK